jgi:GDP/UDP-N,N'-diacetylbacillosamine 2-epimerase (hydrolysing)
MRIGILTSSRADYGIYLPLLEKMKRDPFFSIEIIAFGTHLSKSHGYTLKGIQKDGYPVIHSISSLISNDDEQSIASSYGLTVLKFADFWASHKYDLVFCLGDRFEMSAAVQAGIPFGVQFAHIHGGEITLGAIDNVYRHQITLASILHFTATEVFKNKVANLLDTSVGVFTVGSLSLDNIQSFIPIEKKVFYDTFEIPYGDYALVTFHPETVSSIANYSFAKAMKNALAIVAQNLYVVITMPNADTLGSIYREELIKLKNELPERILLIENFGKVNYFSAMYYAQVLIGNTSSGILEAASFEKYVVNVGDRQKGRVQSDNVLNCEFEEVAIVEAVDRALSFEKFSGENVYFKKEVANTIIKSVKEFL